MRSTASATILRLFAVSMSVCLLYSSQLPALTRLGSYEGLTCPGEDTVFSFSNILSDIQCVFQCRRINKCVAVFFHLSKGTCVGCNSFRKEEMATEEGSLCYVNGCGDPPPIEYGNIIANSLDTASVICDPRFKASTTKITCNSNGMWDSATCEEHDCYLTTTREYKGKRNTTSDNLPCLRWDSEEAVSRGHTDMEYYPESTLSEAENYCRSPTSYVGELWCYVKEPDYVYSGNCGIDKCV